MKFLKKLRSSNFWVSMISAVVLILQAVFDVTIKAEYLNQIIMAILGLLVMSGIISDSSSGEVTVNQSLDIDNIKSNLTEMLTQTSSSIEGMVLSIVSQLQAVNNSNKTEIATEVVANTSVENKEVVETNISQLTNPQNANIENVVQNTEVKVESVAQPVTTQSVAIQPNFDTL